MINGFDLSKMLGFRFETADNQPRVALEYVQEEDRYLSNSEIALTAPNSATNSPLLKQYDNLGGQVTHIEAFTPFNRKRPAVVQIAENQKLYYLCENVKIKLNPVTNQHSDTDSESSGNTEWALLRYTPRKPKSPLQSLQNSAQAEVQTEHKITQKNICYHERMARVGMPRSPSQKQVMQQSATEAANEMLEKHAATLQALLGIDEETFKQIKKEWCHSQAFSLNGDQSKENLNAGSIHFNSAMLAYEQIITFIVYANHQIHGFSAHQPSVCLYTDSEVYAGTDVLKSFTYEFCDLRERNINGGLYQMSFCIKWDNPLTMQDKPSYDGFKLLMELFQRILNGERPHRAVPVASTVSPNYDSSDTDQSYSPNPKKIKTRG